MDTIIKNLTLKKFTQGLLFIAFLSLLFRLGNFSTTFIPKPFEIFFVLVGLLTLVDLVVHKKFKTFFLSIDKRIWIALGVLVGSILVGWLIAIFIKGIAVDLNSVLELGTFLISIGIFILTLFYIKDDKVFAQRYSYALLLPAVYIVFLAFPSFAYFLNIAHPVGFLGFTLNPNIISKILLIPIVFFMTHSLFSNKHTWIRVAFFAVSASLVALLFWTGSRGGIISFVITSILLWLVFSFRQFNWKKLIKSGVTILVIILVGFMLTPGGGKQRLLIRVFYPSGSSETSYEMIQDLPAREIISRSITDTSRRHTFLYAGGETRFTIWPVYTKFILMNPLGIGPNTHISFNLTDNFGKPTNSGPHNTYLQIWMWGGVLGILSFLYIFIGAYKNLWRQLKSNPTPATLALFGILCALSFSVLFDDSLSFYWFFIILALSLGHEGNTEN